MNERLSTNVEVDGSRVGVDLVHKVVAVVDQVFLQVSEPETLRLWKRKGDRVLPAVLDHNQELAVL